MCPQIIDCHWSFGEISSGRLAHWCKLWIAIMQSNVDRDNVDATKLCIAIMQFPLPPPLSLSVARSPSNTLFEFICDHKSSGGPHKCSKLEQIGQKLRVAINTHTQKIGRCPPPLRFNTVRGENHRCLQQKKSPMAAGKMSHRVSLTRIEVAWVRVDGRTTQGSGMRDNTNKKNRIEP